MAASETIRRIVRAGVGDIVTSHGPSTFARLSLEERLTILAQYEPMIEVMVEALARVAEDERKAGIAETHKHFRRADALDTMVVDAVMESRVDPDEPTTELRAPRTPWAGGL